MENLVNTTNTLIGLGTIFLQISAIIILIALIFNFKGIKTWLNKKHLHLVFLIVFFATMGSFWYSNVIGYEPCLLCWYQRIAMFPMAIIFFIALMKKYAKEYISYGLALSVIGILLAGYHNIGRIINKGGNGSFFPCTANSVSCADGYVNFLNYIDIPAMSLTIFVIIFLILLNKKLSTSE
jgi:disulfide bond formation protein DsbB